MEIVHAEKQHFKLIQQFLAPFEHTCVQLASYVRKQSAKIYILQKDSKIAGILYLDSTLFHCIPSPQIFTADEAASLQTFLASASTKNRIKCVSGVSTTTRWLVQLLEAKIGKSYQTNHYKLMVADQINNPPEELANDDEIIRCTENDMETLLQLQKQYMNEEVAPFGKTVSDPEASMSLRQILKNQLCLALFSDGEPVAKANTNAIGINYIQLGGIYTQPLFRRNGYAWQLISAICRRTSNAGKRTALFVKDINVPAIELYKKLGFKEAGLYEISYF